MRFPESSFEIMSTDLAKIIVFDGHVADAKDIQKAINKGFTFFYNYGDADSGYNLLCSKNKLAKRQVDKILENDYEYYGDEYE